MTDILTLHHVQKRFGSQQVLQDVDFSIPTGSIFGFVGENGAGKTTTMRLILGLEKIDNGQIEVGDVPVTFGATKTNRITGYLPDVPAFYSYMTPREYLNLCAEITGIPNRAAKITEMLQLVGLPDNKHRIRGFSRGMKQRLGIAQALLNDPQLLICDEPTSALDPAGRNEFLELLASLRGKVTVLFSTHILSDVERISDRVGILHDGRLQACDTLTNLHQQYGQSQIAISFAAPAAAQQCATVLRPTFGDQVTVTETTVTLTYQGDYTAAAQQVLRALVQADLTPTALHKVDPTLEQIFLAVIKK
ncbi:ABC transporter ATP-binding protein [Schleiferilactobacillus perolens]|uniref:ABC superfamily ATP binding cassette transporter, ABC protein n=1 Tax=Schleiferilactobacillus perolens DSM 12744 TaxID=1423792 RepID=A0A0R1N311_9LACO|nr:ABC transporter ATP-binding protein [Schleiferilactobacillus perolens]KRL11051.1 ABC superfamily ATP binding cassette transporter, ABC protein [Schleiferilactobacillus perolens DSM 12744]